MRAKLFKTDGEANGCLIAVVAFVLPLLGIHQRLVKEKSGLESDINSDMEIVHQELRERMIFSQVIVRTRYADETFHQRRP